MATIIGCRTLDEWTQSYSRFIHEETEAQSHTSGHRPASAPGSGAFSSRDLPRDTVLVPLISLGMTLSASTGPVPPLPLSTGDPVALCTREHEEQGPFEQGGLKFRWSGSLRGSVELGWPGSRHLPPGGSLGSEMQTWQGTPGGSTKRAGADLTGQVLGSRTSGDSFWNDGPRATWLL